jgi:hypothetical protein
MTQGSLVGSYSEEPPASTIMAETPEGGERGFPSEILVNTYQTTRYHKPGVHNLKLHRRENPKSQT